MITATEVRQQIGQRIKEERLRIKLSQTSFGALGGVGKAAQHLYEKGERMPSVEYLTKLSAAGMDFRYILTGERSTYSGGEICLAQDVLARIFRLVDELGRDSKGRLLDVTYREELLMAFCLEVAELPSDSIDWDELRRAAS